METGWRAPPPSKAKRVKDRIICYFSIHWLKCGVDPISTAIVEVWKWFKGMKQHSLLSCLHSAHRLQFIVRNCGTRFKCNMVSLQSLIFVVYTYYLTLQFVDKFSVFPQGPCLQVQQLTQVFSVPSVPPLQWLSSFWTLIPWHTPKPLLLWPDLWVFPELSFFTSFVSITAVRKSGLWDPMSHLTDNRALKHISESFSQQLQLKLSAAKVGLAQRAGP